MPAVLKHTACPSCGHRHHFSLPAGDLNPGHEYDFVSVRAGAQPFTVGAIESALRSVVETQGTRPAQVFQPVRVAIAGSTVSPGIFESVTLLGREETLARIDRALDRADSGKA